MSLEVFLNEMTNELDKKYLTFSEKLHAQKENLKIEFKKKLVELVKLSSTINNTNPDSNEGKSKEELSKAASSLKQQIQTLINNMELMEKYVSQISNKKNEELIKIKEDNFILAIGSLGISLSSNEENVEANPASKKKRDVLCFDCNRELIWGKCWDYYNTCNYSSNCNDQYRYRCTNCAKRFCTNCKYPVTINTCGCKKILVRSTTLYSNNCDLCRSSGITNGWRCSDCDYDVCDSCFNTK